MRMCTMKNGVASAVAQNMVHVRLLLFDQNKFDSFVSNAKFSLDNLFQHRCCYSKGIVLTDDQMLTV